MPRNSHHCAFALILGLSWCANAAAQPEAALREQSLAAMKRAATFYRTKVASHGGYVYLYTDDLSERWGEGKAGPDTIFVQPPGTPTVGMAYLKAYEATKDLFYLDAAKETAEALVYGQLESGGWTQTIHFAQVPGARMGKYRNGKGGNWNGSSLDDDQTQAALRFLAAVDKALGFKHEKIHEATLYGLDALVKAQFKNGAFPQVWQKPAADQPIVPARFPDYDWKTEGRVKNYWDYYTLNDGLAGSVSDTLIAAHQTYGDAKYKAALTKLGDFLILAQMPDPQPGWCQQYSYEMTPIWARKFEPPAITGSESQDAMLTLIRVAEYTGDAKYLAPIPKALAYYKSCLLKDGRLPRFIELKTNKPLYMNGQYELTYDDSQAPSHYGWQVSSKLDRIEKRYEEAKAGKKPREKTARPAEESVKRVIASLDGDGRWLESLAGQKLPGQVKAREGTKYISSSTFIRNLGVLSEYVARE